MRVRDSHSGALPTEQQPRGRLPEAFYNLEQAQGGALTDLCHPVYLVRYLLGRPHSVSAMFGYVTGRAVEDNAAVMLRYPNGAIGIAETAFVAYASPFSIEVHGTHGSVLYSETGIGEMMARRSAGQSVAEDGARTGPDGKLHIRCGSIAGADERWLLQETGKAAPKAFDQWLTHIGQGTQASENMALGLDLTAIVEAANRSDATGERVDLGTMEHA